MPSSASRISAWPVILEHIEQETTPQQYATWFRNLKVEEITDSKVVMSIPSRFHRDWIRTYYREVLERAVAASFDSPREVELLVAAPSPTPTQQSSPSSRPGSEEPAPTAAEAPRDSGTTSATPAPSNEATPPAPAPSLGEGSRLAEGLDFDNFVTGSCNQLASAAGISLAKNSNSDFAAMLVSSATGLGKTHLLQAICRLGTQHFGGPSKVAYIRAEAFVNDFVQSIGGGQSSAFRERYRSLDFVCFDDLQVLAGKERSQQEFLHTFTAWMDRGTRVVLAARCAPGENLELDPQLLAQLSSAFRITLHQPDTETQRKLIHAKAAARGEALPEDVTLFLRDLPVTNIRELEGAVTSVIVNSRLSNVPISLASAKAALQHDSFVHRPVASPDRILNVVCHHFDVKLTELTSARRPQALSFTRQVAMYLLRERTELSLSEIGELLGGRDHTTILHGIRKIEGALDNDARLRDHLTRIRAILDR